jgi:hypothetical protein
VRLALYPNPRRPIRRGRSWEDRRERLARGLEPETRSGRLRPGRIVNGLAIVALRTDRGTWKYRVQAKSRPTPRGTRQTNRTRRATARGAPRVGLGKGGMSPWGIKQLASRSRLRSPIGRKAPRCRGPTESAYRRRRPGSRQRERRRSCVAYRLGTTLPGKAGRPGPPSHSRLSRSIAGRRALRQTPPRPYRSRLSGGVPRLWKGPVFLHRPSPPRFRERRPNSRNPIDLTAIVLLCGRGLSLAAGHHRVSEGTIVVVRAVPGGWGPSSPL